MEEAKPNGLWVDHLEIRNFRLFDHLSIPAFGHVNLIVGKNNTGKTTLLEALCVLVSRGAPQVLREIIAARDEGSQAYRGMDTPKELNRYPLINLFSRGAAVDQGLFITSGGSQLTIDFRRFREVSSEEGGYRLDPVDAPAQEDIENFVPVLVVRSDQKPLSLSRHIRLDRWPIGLPGEPFSVEHPGVFISSSGLPSAEAARLWDRVALTQLEDNVISSLRLMCPEIERISMVAGTDDRTRSPRAKIAHIEQPVPLRSLGEGVNRVFGMALALVNVKGGLILIDEIENGIHYSAQEELWGFIMQLAHHLRVQVFATTHSSDAVKAFQLAARSAGNVQAVLTRLEERNGSMQVTQFSEDDLAIATREAIEVR